MSEKIPVVIDTTVLLNFFERVTTFREKLQQILFDNFEVYAPGSVIQEATSSSKSKIQRDEIVKWVTEISPDYDKRALDQVIDLNNRIDRGEIDVVLCAIESGYAISTDDLAAIKVAKENSLTNHGTISLLKLTFDDGVFSSKEIETIIAEIRSKGGRFKNFNNMTFEEYYKQYLI